MKKTLLTFIAALLLGGAASAQNYWGDDPDSHAQPSNTPIVASVGTLDGVAATITDDCRLGAFVGDELRGIAAPHTDGKFWIQVFYTATTDNITFKFYDGTTEYATCANLPLTGSDEGYGTPGDPVVLNFTNGQTVELAAGYNWWSTNLVITIDDLKNALEAALPSTTFIRITAQDGSYTTYNGTRWRNSVNWDVTKHYIIQLTESCEITLAGQPINPEEHPITIAPNYNWIAFPLSESITVSTAFAGYTATNNDRITAQDGTYATYSSGRWRGQLTTLQPGKGYIFSSKASENQTLIFQSSSK